MNTPSRYIQPNSGSNTYTFTISMVDCGTSTYDEAGTLGFENTIIIQMEEIVQEVWDTARRISCDWKSTFEKEVVFNPIQVGMLNVEEVRFSGDNVECWMDIKRGNTPFGNTVDGILEIGEDLTVVVYAADGGSNFDILVKNCYAYDSTDYTNPETTKLPLIDAKGCLLKEKLMGYFRRTFDTRETGASIIAYARLNAFKFPDKMGVYLTCDVELCKGGCTDFCEDPGYPSEPEGTLLLPETTPRPTRPPPVVITTTEFVCTPGSQDPRCVVETPAPPTQFVCTPGSQDPRCQPIPTRPPPVQTTTQFVCTPGSLDPRCPQPTTQFVCTPGSLDPRCPQPTTQFVCTPGSLDPRCPQPTTQFVCRPGSLDPRCAPPPTQPPRPQTRPPVVQPTQFVCQPGSLDPRCVRPTQPPRPIVTRPPQIIQTQEPQGHYGNKDPMYHSFHKWMYEPAPSRFTRRSAPVVVRRKRQVVGDVRNATITFAHGFAVLAATDLAGAEGDSTHLAQQLTRSDNVCLSPAFFAIGVVTGVAGILLSTSTAVIYYAKLRAFTKSKEYQG